MAFRNSRLWLVSLICLLGCGAEGESAGTEVDAAVDPIGSRDFGAFDDAIEAFLSAKGLAGAGAIIVQRDEGVVHETTYGTFESDRLYMIASSSKILSAGVLAHLADRGVVDLDAPLSRYVPDWGDGKAELTLAQLLSNSSGMLGLIEDSTYSPYVCQFLAPFTLTGCAQAIFGADDADTRMPPDTKFRYGGAAWQLAGGIAEVASKQSWDELLEETYRKPCGTRSIGYANQFGQGFAMGGEDDAWGYPPFFKGKPENLDATANPNIEGGGYATVSDYGAILLMHLRGGMCGDQRALSQAVVERMQVDRVAKTYGSTGYEGLEGYGMGWFMDRSRPGVVIDPGAYGAMAWLDNGRGYAAFFALESDSDTGHELRRETMPILEAVFDEAP